MADKRIMAARAAQNPTITARHHSVAVLPVAAPISAPGPIRNRAATKMTGVQRDSAGRRSTWNRSPFTPRGGWR